MAYKVQEFTKVDLVGAMIAAFEYNDSNIIKSTYFKREGDGDWYHTTVSNRDIALTMLGIDMFKNNVLPKPLPVLTDELRTRAQEMIDLLHGGWTMQLLRGQQLSNFVASVAKLLEKDTVTNMDAGILAYVPSLYVKAVEKNEFLEKVTPLSMESKYIGTVGSKVEETVEVLKSSFIEKFGCSSVLAVTADGNMVQFFTQKANDFPIDSKVTVRAKVKMHFVDAYNNGAQTTRLNYVKVY